VQARTHGTVLPASGNCSSSDHAQQSVDGTGRLAFSSMAIIVDTGQDSEGSRNYIGQRGEDHGVDADRRVYEVLQFD